MPWNGDASVSSSDLEGAPRTMPVWECCKHWDSVSSIKKDTKWEAWKRHRPMRCPSIGNQLHRQLFCPSHTEKACFTAACDVRNPFFGPNGAAHVFAPQKGADADMVKELDVAMQHLSDVIFHTTGKDVSLHPGAGAAGGMGGSLHAFWMHS